MHCMDNMAANSFENKNSEGELGRLGGGSMRLMDVPRSISEGVRRSSDFFGGVPAASNCCSSEFKRKRTQQNIPEISKKLEDHFGCPVSYNSTPPNSPIDLSASGSSPGSDSEDSTDFSHVKLRPQKFNFSPPRLLPALTAALSNKKRGFAFAMSPSRDLLRMPDFVASVVPSVRRPRQEAPQDVDEDAGPFLQYPPCASEGALSGDAGTDTTYRFKETLREPKPHRKYRGAQPKRQPERSTVNEEEEPAAITTDEELRRRVFGERRPIYFGPRRPAPRSAAADRAAQIGELTEIHDKSFLAVLADDEISFWICLIIKIIDKNEAGEPKNVQLKWYMTEDSNPYTGKFYPEKRCTNGKGRAVLYKQDVDLEEVTILSFNFIFTTTRHIWKMTERQIRTGLFRIARDRHASLPQNQLDADLQICSEDDEEADCSGPDDDEEDD
ncbi:hypothetical protein R1sor_020044 [Riccia sorocarpa]|uniref:BAH domain-containing protein n=1 Tax=Riccia sorocarpa TaxID=122646 RepID=A0ABD3IH01_9MARC